MTNANISTKGISRAQREEIQTNTENAVKAQRLKNQVITALDNQFPKPYNERACEALEGKNPYDHLAIYREHFKGKCESTPDLIKKMQAFVPRIKQIEIVQPINKFEIREGKIVNNGNIIENDYSLLPTLKDSKIAKLITEMTEVLGDKDEAIMLLVLVLQLTKDGTLQATGDNAILAEAGVYAFACDGEKVHEFYFNKGRTIIKQGHKAYVRPLLILN